MADSFTTQDAAHTAWRSFIDELAPLRPDLFRYCCGLTGNVWDGEDLAQNTLARVFSALGKINGPLASPGAYLIRSATNLWIDRLRRASLERSYAEAEADEPAPPQADASQIVDVRSAANSLFVHLAPRERAAVLLADVLDFSHEEAASMLQSTLGAIKQALFRGRAKLKAAAAAPPPAWAASRDVVDRFVTALSNKDYEAIRTLCLADMRVDMVGGASFENYETGKVTIEHAHMVVPAMGMGDNPYFRMAEYEGEPMALGFRTLNGVEGLNEIWRFESGAGGISRLRLYCFTPDVLVAVAEALGVPALDKPYRSWPYGPSGPPRRPKAAA
jgi:RNA polymerase sigma-70 factor (ECF subfamily)